MKVLPAAPRTVLGADGDGLVSSGCVLTPSEYLALQAVNENINKIASVLARIINALRLRRISPPGSPADLGRSLYGIDSGEMLKVIYESNANNRLAGNADKHI